MRYYVEGRRFEWVMSIATLWLAVTLLIAPETLHASAFQWITLLMSQYTIGTLCFCFGWVRLIGLLLNGHEIAGWRVGPLIRSATAVGAAVMWVQFDLALINLSYEQGFMSPGIPFWSMFVVGELDVAYRAVADDGQTS